MQKNLYFGSTLLAVAGVVAVACLVSGIVVALSIRRGSDRGAIGRRLEAVWLGVALLAVATLTLQPGSAGFGDVLPALLNPVAPIAVGDAIANVVLYLPVGFFAALLCRSRTWPVALATGLAFSVSLLIEFAQGVVPISRSAQFHDVLFNTLGGFLGAVAALAVARLRQRPDPARRPAS